MNESERMCVSKSMFPEGAHEKGVPSTRLAGGFELLRSSLAQLTFGKRLPEAVYIFDTQDDNLPPSIRALCAELRRRFELGPEFNVIKFHKLTPKVSFLSYPDFFTDAHPALARVAIIDLVGGNCRRDDYGDRSNPPILHRKDAFLPATHPAFATFASLSAVEEQAGLLTDATRIGFRVNWEKRLEEKGVSIKEHRVVPADLRNRRKQTADGKRKVAREKTAILRVEPSKPIKVLLECNQLKPGESLFDYGCGHGTDVAGLRQLGFEANGWDPAHLATGEKRPADVVNLGFVLNVIEDPAERIETLLDAWSYARRLLVVSTLVAGQDDYRTVQQMGDGILTQRNTFQKYYEQNELQSFIEDTLNVDAVPVALGIFFVFRSTDTLHDFLASRTTRHINWEALSGRLGIARLLRARRDPYEHHRELLDEFWVMTLRLGRTPTEHEFSRCAEVRKACGSIPGAMRLFSTRFGDETLNVARLRRREDLLVYLAASQLRKRIPFKQLSQQLQRDIRTFFGSIVEAERLARELMFASGDPDELELAIESLDFGWLDQDERQLTVHRSFLEELPAVLRVYAECAARLFGNPREADLIKFHLRSGKVTFLHYEGFDSEANPRLKLRIKIDLRRLFVTVFDHSILPEPQPLLEKQRFLTRRSKTAPHEPK